MKERPILFSAPMVRALLAGAKTQTRRIVKFPPKLKGWAPSEREGMPSPDTTVQADGLVVEPSTKAARTKDEDCYDILPCPYGAVGDRLWVRETWGLVRGGGRSGFDGEYDDVDFWERPGVPKSKRDARGYSPTYRADWVDLEDTHFKPSIHMPRWVSRLTLEITEVRVEQLQSMSEMDAIDEGVSEVQFRPDDGYPTCLGYMFGKDDGKTRLATSARDAYAAGWDTLNGKRAPWKSNPWVWAITFKRQNTASPETPADFIPPSGGVSTESR